MHAGRFAHLGLASLIPGPCSNHAAGQLRWTQNNALIPLLHMQAEPPSEPLPAPQKVMTLEMHQREMVQLAAKQAMADPADRAMMMELQRLVDIKQKEMTQAAHAHFTGLSFPRGWVEGDGKGNLQPTLNGAHHRPTWGQPCNPTCADYSALKP